MPQAIRRGLIDQSFLSLLGMVIMQTLKYLFPFVSVLLWSLFTKMRNCYVYVLPMLFASFVGMDLIQTRALYDTYYSYGVSGMQQAMEKTNSLPADRAIMAPYPFVFYRADTLSKYHVDFDWFNNEVFLRVVSNPKMQAIVYTPMDFPVERARELQAPKMVSSLTGLGYKRDQIGSYVIWTRDH